jgi:tetratricopeptide (TPR) repeat protein
MKNTPLLILGALLVVILLIPISYTIRLLLFCLLAIAFIYLKRGYLYVALGSRILNGKSKRQEKAWTYYEKGWKAGIGSPYAVMLGNLYLQSNDASLAIKIFDSVIEKESDSTLVTNARLGRAMAQWVLGEKEQAVKRMKKLYKEGILNKNLLINLIGYKLYLGHLKEAKELIEIAQKEFAESLGMIDNRAYYLFLTGDIVQAKKLYKKLIEEGKPKFPEAYYHGALVELALGNEKEAKELLETSLQFPFYQTSTITKDEVENFLLQVKGEVVEQQLSFVLYDEDLFEDEQQTFDSEELEDLELSPVLDLEDYYDDEEHPEIELEQDELSILESSLFEDEYDDEDES